MRESKWPRQKKQNLSWQNLYARESDTNLRWTVIWDTERHPDSEARNTALEKSEADALDRARHILRMGFVVYEVRDSSGAVLFEEAALKEKLGLSADATPKPPKLPATGTVLYSASPTEDLALAMIEAHGNDAVGIAREKARAARTAGQPAIAQHWLRIVDSIRHHKQVTP